MQGHGVFMKLEVNPTPDQVKIAILGLLLLFGMHKDELFVLVGL